jgi:hypothetical protein
MAPTTRCAGAVVRGPGQPAPRVAGTGDLLLCAALLLNTAGLETTVFAVAKSLSADKVGEDERFEGDMSQDSDQHDQFEAEHVNISDLEMAQFDILSPTQALFVSALSAGDPEQHGYVFEDSLEIVLPDRNWQVLGFSPTPTAPAEVEEHNYRVLFAPAFTDNRTSFWGCLFPDVAPEIVLEFLVNEEDGSACVRITDGWLEWPWWLSSEERLRYLENAKTAYERLFNDSNWLELIEQSVTTGPKSTLFEGVAKQLAARSGVNGAL